MMDELFSCRNCIHNAGQSLLIGQGSGFCLQHESVVWEPDRTTCKYLHRKDLPYFVVEEGTREHAAEFAGFPFLVSLHAKQSIERIRYSEKLRWERRVLRSSRSFARPVLQGPTAVDLDFGSSREAWTAGVHSLTAALVRHYMYQCNTWKSSYRLVLGLLEEIDIKPQFEPREIVRSEGTSDAEAAEEATWDVVFARLNAVQEYGWHAGLETLMWASDALNGSLAELNWPGLQAELATHRALVDQADHLECEEAPRILPDAGTRFTGGPPMLKNECRRRRSL